MPYGRLLSREQTAWMIKEEREKEENRRSIVKEIANMESGSCLEFESEDPETALGWYLVLIVEKVPGDTKEHRVMMRTNSILVYKYKPDEVGGKI